MIRVIQEALTNVRKHSGATHAVVRIAADDQATTFVIEDDGRGFDPARPCSTGTGSGCIPCASAWSSSVVPCRSTPRPGRGTRIIARVPVPPYAPTPCSRCRCRDRRPIRILLVDDQPLFRTAIATLIDEQPDFVVVGEAENGLEAVEQARALQPDLVVMDVEMPVMDGVEAVALIREQVPASRSSCSPSPRPRTTCSTRSATARTATCSRTSAPSSSTT